MSFENKQIITETVDLVKVITFNRPECLNAINDTFTHELFNIFKSLKKDTSIRCVVITANGRGFSAGQDLEQLKDKYKPGHIPSLGEDLRKRYNPIVSMMRNLPIPIIGAINGVAAGAGCSLALACDIRIASEKASFIEVFTQVGLIPDSGSTWTLPRLIGWGRALEMCMTGRKVESSEALQIGLVSKVVQEDELMSTSLKVAQRLSSMPTKALALTKNLLEKSFENNLEEQLELESFAQDSAGKTKDHFEGVSAFIEKRTPVFKGI